MSARRVMALGLAALAVILAIVLLQSDRRRSGSDMTPNGAFILALARHEQACQGGELLPADTRSVRLTLGTYGRPGPAVRVTFTAPGGAVLSDGYLAGGWRQGIVEIPIRHVAAPAEGVRVCLRNEGPNPIAVAGTNPDPGYVLQAAGRRLEARVRYDYLRPGRESWLQLLPTIVHRSTLAKAGWLREWAWVAALLLALAAIAIAVATVVREDPR